MKHVNQRAEAESHEARFAEDMGVEQGFWGRMQKIFDRICENKYNNVELYEQKPSLLTENKGYKLPIFC